MSFIPRQAAWAVARNVAKGRPRARMRTYWRAAEDTGGGRVPPVRRRRSGPERRERRTAAPTPTPMEAERALSIIFEAGELRPDVGWLAMRFVVLVGMNASRRLE